MVKKEFSKLKLGSKVRITRKGCNCGKVCEVVAFKEAPGGRDPTVLIRPLGDTEKILNGKQEERRQIWYTYKLLQIVD